MAKSETILGIDVGEKRVGIAISEAGTRLALPCKTLERHHAVAEIVNLIKNRDVTAIAIGWPLELSGRPNRATRRIQTFESQLQNAIDDENLHVTLTHVDERHTTTCALHLLKEAHVFGKKRKEVVDQLAAVEILETYLSLLQ